MSEIQVLQKKFDDDSAKKFNPLVHDPIFDPTVGLVAVGPRSWRHLLFGLQYGLVTEVADKGELGDTISELAIKDFNVPLPKVAFISSIDREGFLKFFYRRSIGWFTKRYMAQEIGNQALSIVQNKSRPFRDEDLVLGSENLEPWPLKKEPSESEVRMKNWTDKADSLELDNNFLAALEVYSN